jgi:hypothetical protein
MISAPTKSAKSRPAQPCWGRNGVSKLTRRDQGLHDLAAMLPATKSSRAEIVAQLVELRARFHGWLHQDEFGPRRGEQTAAVRAHIKLVRELCRRLNERKSRSRDRLDAALRSSNDGRSPAVAALGEAAVDVESALQITSATNQDIGQSLRAPHCPAGDAVPIAPVSTQVPCSQGILRFWGLET